VNGVIVGGGAHRVEVSVTVTEADSGELGLVR